MLPLAIRFNAYPTIFISVPFFHIERVDSELQLGETEYLHFNVDEF